MIYLEKVSKKYPNNTVALDNITFAINKGEFVSIVGHSGAGKSTILKMIIAEDTPTSGSVFYHSADIHRLGRSEILDYRRKVGAVFQDGRLLPNKTAFENIAFAMEVAGRPDDEIEADVPGVLKLVGLQDKIWNFPHELSGGERQRVAIARAIVNQPEIIIADEPTGNLDPINTMDIINILKKINELGTTIILTTHNKNTVDALGKRVITLDSGKILRDEQKGKYSL
ncbi:MAG: cell division ATP-binding protein FtsE [Candidatus Vogelbacteria bacterium]|nr:cell division ATP-binding protein FtsE [Candidatus Vogelbacteria bacterium]